MRDVIDLATERTRRAAPLSVLGAKLALKALGAA